MNLSITNIFIFILVTVLIAVFSWNYSIRDKRLHGIPRFFSFESIILLLILNLKEWFSEPFSFIHILSWIFLIFSAVFGLAGWILLKRKGKSEGAFENTTVLVQTGLYQYIRHPLYSSLLLLGTGIMLKDPGLPQIILSIINFISLFITAKVEEKEMLSRFGDEYKKYKKTTRMFIPYIF
ncbi:MAG: isoprenylcysteine carboxylmethyltransferase family protein [Bacteroidales bacterium]|nr:isoprenylcysteine carboxylmethyltransferase family protein [Bacteroidales bacterium]